MLKMSPRFRWCASALLALGFLLAPSAVYTVAAETIAVIGTGRVGGALGPRFAKLGHVVIYGSRDPSLEKVQDLVTRTGTNAKATTQYEAAQQADIVVLAVPWSATEEVVKGMGNLDGKIIIDVTNATKFVQGHMEMAVPTSGGELVQSWAPGASVVKAFNTMGSTVMADPSLAGGPVTVPLAGDDKVAKERVAEIIQSMGFETADVGPIRNARVLEHMVIIYLVPMFEGRRDDAFEFYFRKTAK